MAYQKVDQRFRGHAQDQDTEDLPVTSLELEWDMEKELEESAFDGFEADNSGQHHLGNSAGNTDLDFEFMQPSASPRGRFARLEEESHYVAHTRSGPKDHQGSFSKMAKLFVAGFIIFICGFLIGYYGRKSSSNILSNNATTPTPPASSTTESDDGDILQNIVQAIEGDSIRNFFRNLTPFAAESDWGRSAARIMEQWTASGLTEIRLVNYTVLLSLPDTDQNKIILTNSSQCFYPSGQQCSTLPSAPRGKKEKNDLLYFYAAYSAKGSLEAEIVDVQYGTIDDLLRLQSNTNYTKKIALIKLGKAPLLYKLSLLLEVGFGGALVYIDPCDSSPQKEKIGDETFWISLNPGGDPSTPGYPSVGGSFREHRANVTSLLVQPIAASLAKALLSSTETANGNGCFHLTNSSAVSKTIRLEVGTVSEYRTIQNVIGYLKGSINPDKYVIVGSHHGNTDELWTSSTSIITEIIKTMMSQAQKRRWRPNRSIVFCSWGASTFGNIGSYEWAEEMKHVLQSNAVAYIDLFKPVVGNGTLNTVVSTSLRQLAADIINMRFSLNCTSQENCSGPKVNSVQVEGNSDFFINHLGVPTVQFAYHESKTSMGPGFLSEAHQVHSASMVEAIDPFFNLHETVAKLTAEMILRIANEPVLPYSVLDVALEVQEQLKDDSVAPDQMLALANALRETAQLFQSDEMRPAYNPKERDPAHLRMLNDVLQNLEKNFLIEHAPPGYYRNILYHLNDTSNQFSVMKEAVNHCRLQRTNQTLATVSSMVLNSIRSAQVYLKAGLDVFENIQNAKRTN
ncbi:inactive N-acetylated-alpha-linked acidic dipeptidase-like protein 2 [Scyliorhinus torazame]|uniref:inactive N-acetylated-alpha-linked acidic dipeptidase-like protein 2 n=1 Tax=Scyliorhinus torazame TaxID=75743 RepID=UPI003B5B1E5E